MFGGNSITCLQSESRGYALVATLILLVLTSLAASVAVLRASQEAQRQRELELLFVGNQFRQAIQAYAAASSGAPEYPSKLDDLVEDHRGPSVRRFLRRIYSDPMTSQTDWGVMTQGDRIVGVFSKSVHAPMRHANFSPEDVGFESAKSYCEWRFAAFAGPSGAATAALPEPRP